MCLLPGWPHSASASLGILISGGFILSPQILGSPGLCLRLWKSNQSYHHHTRLDIAPRSAGRAAGEEARAAGAQGASARPQGAAATMLPRRLCWRVWRVPALHLHVGGGARRDPRGVPERRRARGEIEVCRCPLVETHSRVGELGGGGVPYGAGPAYAIVNCGTTCCSQFNSNT